jgi:predicted N-acyltransferase
MNRPDGLHLLSHIADIDAARWDALLDASSAAAPPGLRHAYLAALEDTGCVGGRTGWKPAHATLWLRGEPIAAMPLYLKDHSYGEYVFDWAWAQAYDRHGLDYYPKWLSAVPFTPIPGARILGGDLPARQALLDAVLAKVRGSGCSSFHVLFPADDEVPLLASAGMMVRKGVQFHWQNRPGTIAGETTGTRRPPAWDGKHGDACWKDFDAFLASLNSEKRKKIRQERRRAAAHGLELRWLDGHDARAEHWDFLGGCYAMTYALHRSTPYLSTAFFHRLAERMPDAVRLLLACRDGQPIAAAFFLCDEKALYGRYWGALEHLPFLHFELCYYQAIAYCITHGLERFEGGAQGEHKLARGLTPVRTHSAHWIADPRFRRAVDDYLARERDGMEGYVDELNERSPFRRNAAGG